MPRQVKDARLNTRESRSRLKSRGKPYWCAIAKGAHLGYRKNSGDGVWCLRRYLGKRGYEVKRFALADDHNDADGEKFLTFWQAQDAAREQLAAQPKGVSRIRVKDAMVSYLRFVESNRKSAVTVANHIDVFINPELGDVFCDELEADKIREWHAKLAREMARIRSKQGKQRHRVHNEDDAEAVRRRKASANRILTSLKAGLNFSFKDGKIQDDKPWRRVQPFQDVDAARIRYLTLGESTRLVNASDPNFRLLVQGALHSGCRYGELARLRCQDFNRDTGRLSIHTSKSGKPRHVVLTDEGSDFFSRVCAGRAADELVFKFKGQREWRSAEQVRVMRETCKRAGISGASFHTLRHTWASHAVMNSVPLLLVAKNLGHADTRMVERHYGHISDTFLEDAIRKSAPRFGFEQDNVAVIG